MDISKMTILEIGMNLKDLESYRHCELCKKKYIGNDYYSANLGDVIIRYCSHTCKSKECEYVTEIGWKYIPQKNIKDLAELKKLLSDCNKKYEELVKV